VCVAEAAEPQNSHVFLGFFQVLELKKKLKKIAFGTERGPCDLAKMSSVEDTLSDYRLIQ
jgi:hypothetical protein